MSTLRSIGSIFIALTFFSSCQNEKNVAAKTTADTVTSAVHQETVPTRHTLSLNEINKEHKSIKEGMNALDTVRLGQLSPEGGDMFGLIDSSRRLLYIHSRHAGEFGTFSVEYFYKNGSAMYATYSALVHESAFQDDYLKTARKSAEHSLYIINNSVVKKKTKVFVKSAADHIPEDKWFVANSKALYHELMAALRNYD